MAKTQVPRNTDKEKVRTQRIRDTHRVRQRYIERERERYGGYGSEISDSGGE